MKNKILAFFSLISLVFLSSCMTSHRSVKQPETYLQLRRSDFEISDLKVASANTKQILCIDWSRIFKKSKANGNDMLENDAELWTMYYSAPIFGPIVYDYVFDKTTEYAMWELMQANPGYDLVMYPQVERHIKRPIGIGWLYREIDVTVSARLAKIK